jgi:protein-tyrosine phosphatase
MIEVYQRFVRNHAATYRRLIDLLLDEASYPLVFHCTAGKDRTGQAAALVLLALGVPKEAVLDDYLASNQRWAATAGGADIARFSQVSADYLHASLDAMAEHSGSVEGYLRKAIGLDDAMRERLGRLLLAA